MPFRSDLRFAGKRLSGAAGTQGGDHDEADPWLVTKEAARYLHASHRTLERWRVEGTGGPPFTKVGPGLRARVLYRRSDLDGWLARFRYRSTSEYVRDHDDQHYPFRDPRRRSARR